MNGNYIYRENYIDGTSESRMTPLLAYAIKEHADAENEFKTEWQNFIDSQVDVDPEIDAIINENLSSLYMKG